jgi:hypothetical protein
MTRSKESRCPRLSGGKSSRASLQDKAENEPHVLQKRRLLLVPEIGRNFCKGDSQVISLLQVQREFKKEYEPWAGPRF